MRLDSAVGASGLRRYFGALAWTLGGLLAGAVLIQGGGGHARPAPASAAGATASPSLRTKNIEDLRLGDRVAGRNPIREQVEAVAPDPATWRTVGLRMDKGGGRSLQIELLRPIAWIKDLEVEPGGTVDLNLPEMGAVGQAIVVRVGPCPEIGPGDGPAVTGIFAHQADENSRVVELRLREETEAVRVTANHPYWSVDRSGFVPAGELRVGEGVDTSFGVRHVASISPAEYGGTLYNIETTEHVYRVGSLGTLVHNSCYNKGGAYSRLKSEAGEQVHHMPQNAAGIVSRSKGPALGMLYDDHAMTRTFSGRGRITNAADAKLTPMERLQLDVDDIRSLFGDKYDQGIAEMLEYVKTLDEFR